MKRESVCVLVSGGLDSGVLLAEWSRRCSTVWPVYIQQGLAWEKVELFWLMKFLRALHAKPLRPLRVLHVPMNDLYGSHWSTGKGAVPGSRSKDAAVFLPGRNLVLSVKAAVYAAQKKSKTLALGSLAQNPFPDASPQFFKLWGKALSMGLGVPVRVVAPFRQRSKADVIARGRVWPLHLTFSCIAPKGMRHCGRCNKCGERRKAFRDARVLDRTVYVR